MALQNRVSAYGELHAVAARGAWTGNRGVLHDDRRRIVRRSTTRAWITCRLEMGGVRRTVMTPGRWTELFFLDEATSFAAGHRPCFFCRRADAVRFATAWNTALGAPGRAYAPAMDEVLRAQSRSGPHLLSDRLAEAAAHGGLDGLVVETAPGDAAVVVGGAAHPWGFAGYGTAVPFDPAVCRLLTPPATAAAFAAGYRPQIAVPPNQARR